MTSPDAIVVDVRASVEDIHRYLRAEGRQLNCLRVVAMSPPNSWEFGCSSDGKNGLSLRIRSQRDFDVSDALDGRIPELLDGVTVRFRNGEGTFEIDQPLAQLKNDGLVATRVGESGPNELLIKSFMGSELDADWMRPELLATVLGRRSWFGSSRFRGSPHRVTVRCLAHSFEWKPMDIVPSGDWETVRVGRSELRILVTARKRIRIRHETLGDLDQLAGLEPLSHALRAVGLQGAIVELPRAFPVEHGPLGTVVPSSPLRGVVDDLAERITGSATFHCMGVEVDRVRRQREAADLNLRIEQAKSARRVAFKGLEVGSEPSGEYGLVALVHKLEALGAIPLPLYETVAWTNARGIDALGTIQIDPVAPKREFAFIEFEYELENFFRHDHSPAHVELVVCWRIGGSTRTLVPRREDWLFDLAVESGTIPVLVVSALPGLTTK